MVAEPPFAVLHVPGGGHLFKPLLRWYLGILSLAKRRTALWFKETDTAGSRAPGRDDVHSAWFIEVMMQFGTATVS